MDLVLTISLISPVCHHNLVMCHRDYEGNLDTKVQSDCLLRLAVSRAPLILCLLKIS